MKTYNTLIKKLFTDASSVTEDLDSHVNHNLVPIYEDAENLDELKRDTLLSYYYKAGHEKNDPKKGKKREQGTQTAMKKIIDKTMEEGTLKSDRTGQRVEVKLATTTAYPAIHNDRKVYRGVITKTFLMGGMLAHALKLEHGSSLIIRETEITKIL